MSFLERQRAAFSGALNSAAKKIDADTSKQPSPSPSVASTSSAVAPAVASSGTTPTKKIKMEAGQIYSQPELTGTGLETGTQMVFVVQTLKEKDKALTLDELMDHMVPRPKGEENIKNIVTSLRKNPRIRWIPDPNISEQTWQSGTYVHDPIIPGVKTKDSLLKYLQGKKDFMYVSVRDLEDGWIKEKSHPAMTELEREHKILLYRNKKDNTPKFVWSDDPTLWHPIEPEFQALWHKVSVPSVDDIHGRLVAARQKPTNEDPRLKILNAGKKVEKKKRKKNISHLTNDHIISKADLNK